MNLAPEWRRMCDENNKLGDEVDRLSAVLDQIAGCCRENAGPTCNHKMALDFVRQVAELALSRTQAHTGGKEIGAA